MPNTSYNKLELSDYVREIPCYRATLKQGNGGPLLLFHSSEYFVNILLHFQSLHTPVIPHKSSGLSSILYESKVE